MTTGHHSNVPHHATRTEAPNGEGTVHPSREGATLDHPVLDGATEYYGDDAEVSREEVPRADIAEAQQD